MNIQDNFLNEEEFTKIKEIFPTDGTCPLPWVFTPINSKILGVDKLNIESIPGVNFYKGDIFEDEVINYIKSFI